MSSTKREQGRSRTVGGSTRGKQRRQTEATLTRLAQRIKAEHSAVEQAQYDSLSHARKAGDLLNDVKAQLPHGEFMPWVEQHCFKQSTANLYMKVAREWDRLTDSQRVGNISLRRAVQLLYEPEESTGVEPPNVEAGDLFALGLLEPSDLEGLSSVQATTLVAEVREAEADFCNEHWRARLTNASTAERERLEKRMDTFSPLVNHALLRAMAQDTAQRLREGKVGHPAVRRLVRPNLRLKSGVPVPGSGGQAVFREPAPSGRGVDLPDLPITQLGRGFCIEAMTVVQEHRSGERITNVERDAMYIICREVREAVGALEAVLGGAVAASEMAEQVPDGELVAVE